MRVRGWLALGLVGAFLALWTRPAHAEPAEAPRIEPGAAAPTTDEDAAPVVIVFVGKSAESTTLTPLLVELLGRQNVRLDFLRESTFEPSRLLSGGEGDQSVWVFVELSGEHAARLYFRGPHAQRFLLRELDLRDGLDEMGRELIGQVIESSVLSLLRSPAGLSRDQATAALQVRREPSVPTVPITPSERPVAEGGTRFAGWLGVRYDAEWTGSALGAAQGPGGEVGAEWRKDAFVRMTFSVQRWFSETVATPFVKATVQTWPLRLSAHVGWSARHGHSWLFGLGGGVDVTHIEPGPSNDSGVALSAPATHVVPIVRASARYEVDVAAVRLAFELFTDFSTLETHYDLQRVTGTERVAVPWAVRPGAALVLGWRPTIP